MVNFFLSGIARPKKIVVRALEHSQWRNEVFNKGGWKVVGLR